MFVFLASLESLGSPFLQGDLDVFGLSKLLDRGAAALFTLQSFGQIKNPYFVVLYVDKTPR